MGELVPGWCVFGHSGASWVLGLEPRGKLAPRPGWQDFVLVYFLAYSLRKQCNLFLMLHGLSIQTSNLSCLVCDTLQLCLSIFHCRSAFLTWSGERSAGGTGYTLHGLLWSEHWAHDHLWWWQAGLDDCSDLSYSCVSTLSQFVSLMFHHPWAILSIFCSGPDLPLEYLLPVTATTYDFSFLITTQFPVIYKHSAISVLHLLLICREPSTPLLTMYACPFTKKPALLIFHLGLLEWLPAPLSPWSTGLCLLPAWYPPGKPPCFPISSQFSRQPSQCN